MRVFLSPNPDGIYAHHGKHGNIYALEVPKWVIKKSGGIHRYDGGSEVLIKPSLWTHVKFLGRARIRHTDNMHLSDMGTHRRNKGNKYLKNDRAWKLAFEYQENKKIK